MLLQLGRGQPGPLLNQGTSSQGSACWGMRCWSMRITCPSQRSLLSLSMSSMQRCPVLALTSSFVTRSIQEMPKILRCHLWWSAFSLFVSVAADQTVLIILWMSICLLLFRAFMWKCNKFVCLQWTTSQTGTETSWTGWRRSYIRYVVNSHVVFTFLQHHQFYTRSILLTGSSVVGCWLMQQSGRFCCR